MQQGFDPVEQELVQQGSVQQDSVQHGFDLVQFPNQHLIQSISCVYMLKRVTTIHSKSVKIGGVCFLSIKIGGKSA